MIVFLLSLGADIDAKAYTLQGNTPTFCRSTRS